jgi:hypothetical protein
MLCTVLCPLEALIKKSISVLHKELAVFLESEYFRGGNTVAEGSEKWLSNTEGSRLSGPHIAFRRWVEEIY